MDQADASKAIFDRWIDLWPTLSSNVPYSLDNTVVPKSAPHAVVNVVSLDSEQRTLGPRAKMLRHGMIDVRLYGPVGVGRKQLDQYVGMVRLIFERKRFGTDPTSEATNRLTTYASSVNELRRDQDSAGLWIVSVTTDFEFYEIIGE